MEEDEETQVTEVEAKEEVTEEIVNIDDYDKEN